MARIETYKTVIELKINDKEIDLNINTSLARGWRELQDVISKEMSDADEIKAVLQVDKKAGAGMFITREAENAKLYIEAIQTALKPSEYEKIADIVEYIDIQGLRQIAVEIINRYSAYYEQRIEEFKK